MLKKFVKVLILILFILLGVSLVMAGVYFNRISSPSYLYKSGMTIVSRNVTNMLNIDDKYIVGDNFSINGSVDVELASDEYKAKASSDLEYLKKYNKITNLSKMDISYNIVQNRSDKKSFLSLEETIGDETIVSKKILIDNATEYYFVKGIVSNYVNSGSNNYYEMFTEDDTTKSNIDYLYHFIIDSISNHLGEHADSYDVDTNIDNDTKSVKEWSIKLTDKTIKNILGDVLNDLKNDKKSYRILSSIDNDFSKKKVDNKKVYLGKKESYTLNVYCSKMLSKPLKYEIVHVDGDSKNIFTYEGNDKKGIFYYSKDDEAKYSGSVSLSAKNINIEVLDSLSKEVGSIRMEKDIDNFMFSMNLRLDNDSYDVVLSSKNRNYVKGKSYDNEVAAAFKISNNNVIRLNGDISVKSKISTKSEINEDVSNAILESTISEEQRLKIDNLYNDVTTRIER